MTNSIIVIKGRPRALIHASKYSHFYFSNIKKTGYTPLIFIRVLYYIFYDTRRDGAIRTQEFEHCAADLNMKEFSCVEAQRNEEGEE
jgi:hypothetical protein